MAKETQKDNFVHKTCPILSIGGQRFRNDIRFTTAIESINCEEEDCAWYSKPNHACAIWLMAEIMINKFISDNPQAKVH